MIQSTFDPGQPYDYPLIIKKLLATPLLYVPDQQIVYRDLHTYTYREMGQRVARLANMLARMGIEAGDTVAVLDYDSHRYLECFFAIPMMGAVLQTVNWRLSAEQILYTLNHAGAKIIITNADFLPIVERLIDQLQQKVKIVVMSDGDQEPDTAIGVEGFYDDLLASAPEDYDFPDLDENTKATTFYTTGTTGLPKGVFFSHRQLVLHTLSVAVALGCYETLGRFRSNDIYMPLTPMFHVHAWGIPYVASLLGVKQVYPGKYEPEMLLKLIMSHKVTFSHCVPTILQMLVTSPAVKKLDLSAWKVVIGGARMPKGLARAARELGITVFTGYGMSETCPVITLAHPMGRLIDSDEETKLDIVTKTGLPIPLVEVEIVDDSDRPLPHDGKTPGEVVFRAPWLTAGYFKDSERSKQLWTSGYLHSGDVGNIDQNGYLQITDRIKDVIKSGGEWISSLDLENILSQHEAVAESAAIGIPDPKWGERPMMLVVLKPGHKDGVTPADLQSYMQAAADKGLLPRYAVPEKYVFVDELPKTSVGKLDKKEMRRKFR